MRNIWTIAKREYKIYFSSPLAYIVMLIIFGVIGVIFALNIINLTSNPFGFNQAPDATIVTGPMAFMLVFSAPALTMRLLADEQRMGTLELLLTAPVRDWELVVGKWFGSFLFVLTIIGFSLIFPLILNSMVDPGIDQQLMLSSYLGIILIAAAFLSIGVSISAMFSNQFAAFFLAMGLLVILWFLIGIPSQVIFTGGEIFDYLNMNDRFYNSLSQGIINLSDIVYFLSITALGLLIGSVAIETRRWR
ncbi:MAG: ABC transporter permease subunit [Anaerolineales bacterium]|nr:ABC transporter permease subunit [Anaerolineales bacterium]